MGIKRTLEESETSYDQLMKLVLYAMLVLVSLVVGLTAWMIWQGCQYDRHGISPAQTVKVKTVKPWFFWSRAGTPDPAKRLVPPPPPEMVQPADPGT